MITAYIADDEIWIVLGLTKLLQRSDFDINVIGTANNGLTAREEIEALKPEIVFTDIRMPGMTGLELLQSIHESSPETEVVIISGYAEFEYAQQAVKLHAYDYLLKPIKEEELKRVLENYQAQRMGTADSTDGRSISDTGSLRSTDTSTVSGNGPSTTAAGNINIPGKRWDSTIDRVVADIREHYTEDISLTHLADKYNISTGRLSTMIKEELQMNYSDYIASLRIQRAKELLQNEVLSIQEIAEQVGYNDYFYFTKVFKKVQGISPSKYRKSL